MGGREGVDQRPLDREREKDRGGAKFKSSEDIKRGRVRKREGERGREDNRVS